MYSERLRQLEGTVSCGNLKKVPDLPDSVSIDAERESSPPEDSHLSSGMVDHTLVILLLAVGYEFAGLGIGFAREVSRLSSLRRMGGHLLLRIMSWIFVAPFYAASLVEIVQSEKASEPTNLVSCIRDGLYRIFHMPATRRLGSKGKLFRGGAPIKSLPITTSRLLPIWRLIPPVILLNVGHYVIRSVTCVLATAYWSGNEDWLEREAEVDFTLKTGGVPHSRLRTTSQSRSLASNSKVNTHSCDLAPSDWLTLAHQRQETALQSIYTRYYTDLLASMTANMVADVITYPLETLVIRLCVQGTRTLVDNMDTGDVVVPIVSSYDGLADAVRFVANSPVGMLGLYRGFGALITQYALQAMFLYGVRCLYQRLLYLWPPSLPSEAMPDTQSRHIPYDSMEIGDAQHSFLRVSNS
ncbi:solute carrier family 25, member 46 [Paragonimus westermani]|uniref:Solute carrier family 25, member 46 n=1 Tax=Paragonimus westermani TaxID=34504 RepID=A0A5J4NI75_9TREM|nr:solute carrier family 25, member 46 [Paragonimus westermani]